MGEHSMHVTVSHNGSRFIRFWPIRVMSISTARGVFLFFPVDGAWVWLFFGSYGSNRTFEGLSVCPQISFSNFWWSCTISILCIRGTWVTPFLLPPPPLLLPVIAGCIVHLVFPSSSVCCFRSVNAVLWSSGGVMYTHALNLKIMRCLPHCCHRYI